MKQNKLKLNGATISGPGMAHAINPSIITGPEDNGYAKGELMDANAVKKQLILQQNSFQSCYSNLD